MRGLASLTGWGQKPAVAWQAVNRREQFWGHWAAAVFFGVGLGGCGEDAPAPGTPVEPGVSVTPAPAGQPWETLEEWHLFADAPAQKPARRVIPYDVISPLYADDANKHRFLYVPDGKRIDYQSTRVWRFPQGSILVKTFAYPRDARDPAKGERLLETRLLLLGLEGWTAETYVWDEAQTRAVRTSEGTTLDVSWIDQSGNTRTHPYAVPTTEQCSECHGTGPQQDTLGGRTRQLDRDFDFGRGAENQIDYLARQGFLDGAPPPAAQRQRLVDPFGSAALADRVRSYLDANCAHCHTLGSGATESGLFLSWEETDSASGSVWGVCKTPIATRAEPCGLTYDIVPGSPEQSILICRMESRQKDVQMPEVGSLRVDTRGVELMREWIAGLTPAGCP
jgi:uncharacterized repeat protein (TIGR03806 family)